MSSSKCFTSNWVVLFYIHSFGAKVNLNYFARFRIFNIYFKLLKDPQYATQVKDLKSFINQGANAAGGMGMVTSALSSGGVTHNYGGVVINVLGDNAKKIAETIKKMFSDEKILEKAASK